MSCALTQGYSKGCRDAQGGVKKFYITEQANIASITSSSGVISAITMNAGKKFFLYEQEINTAEFTETITPSRQNGTRFYDQNFTASLLKRASAINYELRALSVVNVAIIVCEQTGNNYLLGETNGLNLEPSASKTGKAMGDMNGYELVFKGQEPLEAQSISQTLINTII